jgi:hypothetical protein
MGHTIGTHSHTHISLYGQNYSKNIFEKEIIYTKFFLESKNYPKTCSLE